MEDPAGPITRGQASLLFYNMLTIPAKGDKPPLLVQHGPPPLAHQGLVHRAGARVGLGGVGLGDGRFGPDQIVTYQEAVTLALRILEYGTEANRAWPHSAVETAAPPGRVLHLDILV